MTTTNPADRYQSFTARVAAQAASHAAPQPTAPRRATLDKWDNEGGAVRPQRAEPQQVGVDGATDQG